MLRIDLVERNDGRLAIQVEGKLAGESVTVLEQECRRLIEGGRTVLIDVSEVTYVDHDGVSLLLELDDDDVVVAGSSAFIREQLRRRRG